MRHHFYVGSEGGNYMEILSLGEKIRRKRKSLRLTLKDVAGDNVTAAQLSYVESNKCKPSKSLLKYICSKIDLDMEYVLESESQQAAKYCDYYLKEYEFYIRRKELKEADSKLLEIEKLALEYGLDRYCGIVSYKRGVSFFEKKDYDSAQYNFLGALQVFMRFNDTNYLPECYRYLGQIALKKNCAADALEFYKRSLETLQKNEPNNNSVYFIMFDIAKAYHILGNNEEAQKYLSQIIERASNFTADNKEILMEITALCGKIFTVSTINEYNDKFHYFYKIIDYKNGYSILQIIKAMACIREKDYKTAFELLNAVSMLEDREIDEYLTDYLLKISFMLYREHPEYTYKILSQINSVNMNDKQYAVFLYLKSQINKDIDSVKSRELLIKALSINQGTINRYLSVLINNEIGELYKKDKKYRESIKYFEKSAQLLSSGMHSYIR